MHWIQSTLSTVGIEYSQHCLYYHYKQYTCQHHQSPNSWATAQDHQKLQTRQQTRRKPFPETVEDILCSSLPINHNFCYPGALLRLWPNKRSQIYLHSTQILRREKRTPMPVFIFPSQQDPHARHDRRLPNTSTAKLSTMNCALVNWSISGGGYFFLLA